MFSTCLRCLREIINSLFFHNKFCRDIQLSMDKVIIIKIFHYLLILKIMFLLNKIWNFMLGIKTQRIESVQCLKNLFSYYILDKTEQC